MVTTQEPFVFPIEIVREQLPERIRNRMAFYLVSDPYRLRVEVLAVAQGVTYSSGVLEIKGRSWQPLKLPDWFVAHLCTIPLEDEPKW